MATQDVFQNSDLLKLILKSLQCTGSADERECFTMGRFGVEAMEKVGVVMLFAARMRSWKAAKCINRLCNAIASQELKSLFCHFEQCMCTFDALAKRAIGSLCPAYELCTTASSFMWPYLAFDLKLTTSAVGDVVKMLDQYLTRRDPTTCDELIDLLERKCVCCEKPFSLASKYRDWPVLERAWIGPAHDFGAWAMHPYRGTIKRVNELHVLQGTIFPFTHPSHFIEVEFVYDEETSSYYMRLHVYSTISTEERQFSHFLRATRNAEWYQPRIKRIFDLRNRVLYCEQRSNRRTTFLAHICILAPRIADHQDWSVQSIFGLTRHETLAMIKRGGAMVREERLLRFTD